MIIKHKNEMNACIHTMKLKPTLFLGLWTLSLQYYSFNLSLSSDPMEKI